MRIAVCDDENIFLEDTAAKIKSWKSEGIPVETETFASGDSLIREHFSNPFDIIFLDIVMPFLNGIETAKEIRQKDKTVKIIFLTSSREFAVDSYSVKASDYLIKPLETERLFSCLDELSGEFFEKENCITVKSRSVFYRIETQNIEYLEAQNKNVLFFLSDGRKFESTDPLYEFEKMLLPEKSFFKTGRSYIVNIGKVESFNQKEITMRSGTKISISRGLYKPFEEAYFAHVFRKAGEK